MPFPCSNPVLDPGAKPLEPFGERLECSEGGSTGRRTNRSCRLEFGPAVRSAPNQDRWSPGFIGFFAEKARQNNAERFCDPRALRPLYSVRPVLVPLKPIGKLYGEVGAFADLPRGVIGLMGHTNFLERLEEAVQILRQELPAKDRIDPCPNKLILGNRVVHRALVRRIQLEIVLTSVCRKVTRRRENLTGPPAKVSFGPIYGCGDQRIQHVSRFCISGPRQSGCWNGQVAGGELHRRAGYLRRSGYRSRRQTQHGHIRRTGRYAYAHRKCAACPDGSFTGRVSRDGERSGSQAEARCAVRRRSFAR